MPLTKPFRETVQKRAKEDPEFRLGLLTEAVESFLRGKVGVAKILLRDYVNATIGFQSLAEQIDTPKQSLMRMLSEKGNPRAENLAGLISLLLKHEGVTFHIEAERSTKTPRPRQRVRG